MQKKRGQSCKKKKRGIDSPSFLFLVHFEKPLDFRNAVNHALMLEIPDFHHTSGRDIPFCPVLFDDTNNLGVQRVNMRELLRGHGGVCVGKIHVIHFVLSRQLGVVLGTSELLPDVLDDHCDLFHYMPSFTYRYSFSKSVLSIVMSPTKGMVIVCRSPLENIGAAA